MSTATISEVPFGRESPLACGHIAGFLIEEERVRKEGYCSGGRRRTSEEMAMHRATSKSRTPFKLSHWESRHVCLHLLCSNLRAKMETGPLHRLPFFRQRESVVSLGCADDLRLEINGLQSILLRLLALSLSHVRMDFRRKCLASYETLINLSSLAG